jgi:hypothetical protein
MTQINNAEYMRIMGDTWLNMSKCTRSLYKYTCSEDEDVKEMATRYRNEIETIVTGLFQEITIYTENIPIIKIMTSITGVSLIHAVKVVSLVDINKSPSVSSLWRFAGYGVFNGKTERRRKGEILHYCLRLKTTCWQIADSLKKNNIAYANMYKTAMEFYTSHKPYWDTEHFENAANRKMIKVWLSHLWITWRRLEELPIAPPYPEAVLEHKHIYKPEDFGWKV